MGDAFCPGPCADDNFPPVGLRFGILWRASANRLQCMVFGVPGPYDNTNAGQPMLAADLQLRRPSMWQIYERVN